MSELREDFHCRRCGIHSSFSTGRKPFASFGARPHYAPDLPARLEKLTLEATVDPRARVMDATVLETFRAIQGGLSSVRLDQAGLEILEVRVDDEPAVFEIDAGSVLVRLPGASRSSGDLFELAIRYRVRNPKRGLYFTGPDAEYPAKPYQAWSQGQDEDSRHWIPIPDYPNQKVLSEVIARVPKGFTAVSNGALVSKKDSGESTVFHYRLGVPHVTYLISLVVAELEAWEEAGPRGVPVQYFVPKGQTGNGRRAFGNTPKMLEAFERLTGVPYPYEKYSQVAVQDFIFGGMENTSATTQTDMTLHDAKAHVDFSSDPLVSHELAHQWFGDLVTCRDWSHGWLNEGFATFMERVWIEENVAEYGSREQALEEARYYSLADFRAHAEEDSGSYRRPIVCNQYIEPIDLFDTHLYHKGGLVLNLLRATLGAETFWKVIRRYLERHRGGSVETIDLIRAIEDETGRNLRRFFDQWVFSAGYPELEATYSWNEERKQLELVVEQKQTEGKPEIQKDGALTPLFHLDLEVEVTHADSKREVHRIAAAEARTRVFLAAASKPAAIRLDPGGTVPKALKFPRPKEMLLHQLRNDPDCLGRIEAAQELVKISDADIIAALERQVAEDAFWGVRAEIAKALSEIRSDAARDALIGALASPGARHAKARRAIVKALGTFRDAKAATALRPLAERDESYFVEAEALEAWAAAALPPGTTGASRETADAESFLIAQLSRSSHLEVVRRAALKALGGLPGIGRGDRPKALESILEWSRRGKPEEARVGAVVALGAIARGAVPAERSRVLERLSAIADEPSFRLRRYLLGALGQSESPEAISILMKLHRIEIDGRIRRGALAGVDALTAAGTPPESVQQLRTALEQLQDECRRLRGWVEESRAGQGGASRLT